MHHVWDDHFFVAMFNGAGPISQAGAVLSCFGADVSSHNALSESQTFTCKPNKAQQMASVRKVRVATLTIQLSSGRQRCTVQAALASNYWLASLAVSPLFTCCRHSASRFALFVITPVALTNRSFLFLFPLSSFSHPSFLLSLFSAHHTLLTCMWLACQQTISHTCK